jgi:hypothetical protein
VEHRRRRLPKQPRRFPYQKRDAATWRKNAREPITDHQPWGEPIAGKLPWLTKLLALADRLEPHLSSWESLFCEQLAARVERFGRATIISKRQHDVLERLEARLRQLGGRC